MCCLFGIYDYGHSLAAAQKRRLVSALATASEARSTDATGIAYSSDGHLTVYGKYVASSAFVKKPLPLGRRTINDDFSTANSLYGGCGLRLLRV